MLRVDLVFGVLGYEGFFLIGFFLGRGFIYEICRDDDDDVVVFLECRM
jgi:hypothetical protein